MRLTIDEQARLERAAARLELSDAAGRMLLGHAVRAIEALRQGGDDAEPDTAKDGLVEIHAAARKLADAMKEHWPAARPYLPVNAYGNDIDEVLPGFIAELDFTIGLLSKPGPKPNRPQRRFEWAIVYGLACIGVPLPTYDAAPWILFLDEAYKVARQQPSHAPSFSREGAVRRLAKYAKYVTAVCLRSNSAKKSVAN